MKTCATCGERKGDKAFPADGRTKDNLSHVCATCRFDGESANAMSEDETRTALREFGLPHDVPAELLPGLVATARSFADDGELATVTLARVPILSEGGPYYGTGSPPEGDYYTREDLEEIASANRELAEQVKAANKIGHSKEQRLLANSGLSVDEQPAAGWLPGETFTVEQAEDGKWKLYSDIVKVPAKLAELFKAGAFRTRSVELSRVTSQEPDGKVYETVVTGLAWLGAKAPAVRTLDDIHALYGNARPGQHAVVTLLMSEADDVPSTVTRTVDYAEGDATTTIIWQPETGFQDLVCDLNAALNPTGGSDRRYWVSDVSVKLDRCIVNDYEANATWVVPFSMDDAGEPVPAPATEWTLAEQAWVAATDELSEKNFADALNSRRAAADTESVPELIKDLTKLSDEAVVTLAKTFGFDGDDAATLRPQLQEHLKSFATEPTEPVTKTEPAAETKTPEEAESARKMAELEARASLGATAHEERRVEKREALISYGLRDEDGLARIQPAQVEDWRKFYDANPELATTQLKALPPYQARVYGDDSLLPNDVTTEDAATAGKSAWAEYAAATGIPVEAAR